MHAKEWLKEPRLSNIMRDFLFMLSAVCAGVFAHLGWNGYISDSEIWSVTMAANYGQEWLSPWVVTRTPFYAWISAFVWPWEDSSQIFLAARASFIAIGLCIAGLTFCLAYKISTSWIVAGFATVLLFTHTGFINQGFRIRSDLMASLFCLWFLLIYFNRGHQSRKKSKLLFWLPFGLMLATTPKALQLLFPLALLLQKNDFARFLTKMRTQKFKALLLAAGFLGSTITISWLINLPQYLRLSLEGGHGGPAYWSHGAFEFLFRQLHMNKIFVALLILRFMTCLTCLKLNAYATPAQKEIQLKYLKFSIGIILLMVFTPERLPFFLASLLPFLCVFTSLIFMDLSFLLPKKLVLLRLPTLLIIASIVWTNGLSFYLKNLDRNTNRKQMAFINYIENYMSSFPKARFYDVIGLLPKKAQIRVFAGPNQESQNEKSAQWVMNQKPEFVFYVAKTRFLEPTMSRELQNYYTNFGYGIFALAHRFTPTLPITPDATTKIMETQAIFQPLFQNGTVNDVTLEIRYVDGSVSHVRSSYDHLKKSLEDLANSTGSRAFIAAATPFPPVPQPAPGNLDALFRFDSEF